MPAEKKIKVAREKTITIFRTLTDRTRREVKEEMERLATADYRVSRVRRVGPSVEIDLAKVEDWSLDELISEAEHLMDN